MKKGYFITDDSIIEDEYYNNIKGFIKCSLCNKIFKEPVICKNCQSVYCKACMEIYKKKEGKCPNCEENSEFPKSIDKPALLSNLKFLCQNCKEEIRYNDIESHLKKGCYTNENPSKLFDAIYKKKKLKKLTPDEISRIKNNNKQYINHLSSKKKIFYNSLIDSYNSWKSQCRKVFFN